MTSWNGNIASWTGIKADQLMRHVEERLEWRENVHSAANSRTEDGPRQGKVVAQRSILFRSSICRLSPLLSKQFRDVGLTMCTLSPCVVT